MAFLFWWWNFQKIMYLSGHFNQFCLVLELTRIFNKIKHKIFNKTRDTLFSYEQLQKASKQIFKKKKKESFLGQSC